MKKNILTILFLLLAIPCLAAPRIVFYDDVTGQWYSMATNGTTTNSLTSNVFVATNDSRRVELTFSNNYFHGFGVSPDGSETNELGTASGGGGNFTNPSVANLIISNSNPTVSLLHTNLDSSQWYHTNRTTVLSTTTRELISMAQSTNYFNGLNLKGGNVDIGDHCPFELTSNFTCVAWIYPTATINAGAIIGKWSAGNQGWIFAYSAGAPRIQLNTVSGGYIWKASAGTLPLNAWTFCAITYTGTATEASCLIYTNGILAASSSAHAGTLDSILKPGQSVRFGYASADYSNFNGRVDEAWIFGRVLSSNEIWTAYNGGLGASGDTGSAPWNSGFCAGYHFNETNSTPVADFGPNNFAGTVTVCTSVVGIVANVVSGYTITNVTEWKNVEAIADGIGGKTNVYGETGAVTRVKGLKITIDKEIGLTVLSADPAVQTYPQIYGKAFGTTNSGYGIDSIGNVTRLFSHENDRLIERSWNVFSGWGRDIDMDALGTGSTNYYRAFSVNSKDMQDWNTVEYRKYLADTNYVPLPKPQWVTDGLQKRKILPVIDVSPGLPIKPTPIIIEEK